ncbi:MAG: GHKL domain-containing protein [Oscillospiraceae bacterium]|nr:GHKL domain-containing protein [Oscillospiraceae bacterium]
MGILFLGFLVTGTISWLYCEYLFTRKIPLGVSLIYFCISYLALAGIGVSFLGWLLIIPFLGMNFFLLWKTYDCATKTALLHSAFLAFIMVFSEEMAGLGVSILTGSEAPEPFIPYTSMILLSKLSYLVLSMLGARSFTPHKQSYQEPKMMPLFCSLPLLSALVVVTILSIGKAHSLSPQAELMLSICEMTLLVVNLIFFVLYNHLQKAHAANLELHLSIQKEQTDAAYYQILQERSDDQKILIHDIKNHLITLQDMAQRGKNHEISSYIAQLDDFLAPKTQTRLCSDPTLNMLLLHTQEACISKHIQLECDVRAGTTSFMDATSITALFGNLLSNALEGADSSAGRTIELRVTRSPEQGVVIRIVNDCDVEPEKDMFGRLITKKRDPRSHGVGLKSIERIVQRYGGIQTMYYDSEEHRFHHVIHFPR